jgi:pimeloyl-ACP methyl ester carboxylesterase
VAASEALEELGYPPDTVVHLGESLGTGVVAALQARRPPAGVLLRSPFPRLADVGRHHYPFLPVGLLLRDRFEVVAHVGSSEVPMTVVYGDRDEIVPTALSAEVADAVPHLVEEVVIRGAGHNDPVMFGPRVAEAAARLADEVSPRQ